MHFLAFGRAFSAVMLAGTLVGFVPKIESPVAFAPVPVDLPQESDRSAADDAIEPTAGDAANAPRRLLAAADDVVKPGGAKPKDHVKAKVLLSVDKLPAGDKCKFAVILDVQDGWHINANPPSPDNMIPTQVTVQAKHKSKQLATSYPKGADLEIEELPEPVSVYEGEVLIRGELQAARDSAGMTEELEFQIKYQACNEKTCLPPKTLKLAGKIDIVKPGTKVSQINQKYFAK